MRFLRSKAGTCHVVDRSPSDPGGTSCPVVGRALNDGTWKGHRSLKPEQALESKDCARCETHATARRVMKAQKPPAKKASKSLRRAVDSAVALNAVLEKKAPARKARDVTSLVKSANHPVADERTTLKIKEHAELAEQHGWSVKVEANDRRGLTLTATREDEACVLAYRENGILWNEEIVFKVPGRSVPMHNSGTWRRQVSLPEGKRPIPARPKRFGRRKSSVVANGPESASEEQEGSTEVEGEVIPINKSSLPFAHDADDLVIVDYIKGRTLYWRNNMLAKVVSAQVPSKARMIRFGHTGRGQRRYVSFPEAEMSKDGEIYGPERCVAVEDMLRVR